MASSVLIEDRCEIPLGISSLADFRCWADSDGFPDIGRIDYVAGRIEVDMSPENLFTHGTLKVETARVIANRVKQLDLGHVFSDQARVSCPAADVSAEPDVVFLAHESIEAGKVRLTPKASGGGENFVEIEGLPDLVVEIVSDSSVTKDTQRLPQAYFAAGVSEFWLVDARGDDVIFEIMALGQSRYEQVSPDGDGFRRSNVLACRSQLNRRRHDRGHWNYDLLVRSLTINAFPSVRDQTVWCVYLTRIAMARFERSGS